jgi:hypothetical protein
MVRIKLHEITLCARILRPVSLPHACYLHHGHNELIFVELYIDKCC